MKSLVCIGFGLFFGVPVVAGSVYQWTDEAGRVHFGDKPPAAATVTQVEVKPASGDDSAGGSGLRPAERARLGEISQRERRLAAEKRDRNKRVAAEEKQRARQIVQDAKRCASYQQKITDYRRRLRAGCRVSTCNTYNDQLDRYKSQAARVCR